MNINILPKVFFLTIFLFYIISRYVIISQSKSKISIDFSLDGVDYDMPHEIYYDKNNDYQFINANIIDYDPKTDLFTIKLIDNKEELQVTREKIKTLSGGEYIYYPNKINNRASELIGFYLSIIAFLLCYIYISFSILNEKTFSKILTNTIKFNSTLFGILHEFSHMFLQIFLLAILICFIYFYKDKLNTSSFIDKDWHKINIILLILNLYLFFVYQTPKFNLENKLNDSIPQFYDTNFTHLLITISAVLMLINGIRHYLFNNSYLGYYPYGLALIIIGFLSKYLFKGFLKTQNSILLIIFFVFNLYHTNNLVYDIFFTLLGFNITDLFVYFLNYNKFNYRHIISIILSCYLIILLKDTCDNLLYKITNG